MLQKMTRTNEKGFTLIELMIVIAIIGILAAIAIPNFIAYRNKAFCSAVESDGLSVAGAIANYFSIPSHTQIATADINFVGTNNNTWSIAATAPNVSITVLVTDASGRCPTEYTTPATAAANPNAFWNSATQFTKVITSN